MLTCAFCASAVLRADDVVRQFADLDGSYPPCAIVPRHDLLVPRVFDVRQKEARDRSGADHKHLLACALRPMDHAW